MTTVKTQFEPRTYSIVQAIEKKLQGGCETRGRLEELEEELSLLKKMMIPVIAAYVGTSVGRLNALPGGYDTFVLTKEDNV